MAVQSRATSTDKTSLATMFLMLFILSVLIMVVFVVVIPTILNVTFTKHALTSHSTAVKQIDNCFAGGGTTSGMFKTSNGRWSQFCNDGGKNNYWRIYECKEGKRLVITQFKQGVKRLANYMQNHKMAPDPVFSRFGC